MKTRTVEEIDRAEAQISTPNFTINPKIDAFFKANKNLPTPCLVIDLEQVDANYKRLQKAIPFAVCHYAVKANPARDIMKRLIGFGSHFDAASINEINLCLELGAKPEHILFGNTIKKNSDIIEAYAKGVRAYVCDSFQEIEKLAELAPGSKIYFRIRTTGAGAAWPLSKKFGCKQELAVELIEKAKELGLVPYGISFHVGSQQLRLAAYDESIADAAAIFKAALAHGVELQSVDLGGGFPGTYRTEVPAIEAYGAAIETALVKHFGAEKAKSLRVLIEPGRYMSANAGVLQTEVVLVSYNKEDGRRWLYLDMGKYNGLAEAEAIEYPIVTEKDNEETGLVVMAGPTCDSTDIIYEKAEYNLPLSLKSGDKIFLLATGAYTTTYASISFNGFEPLKDYYIE